MNIISRFVSAPLWLSIPATSLAAVFILLSILVLRTKLGENTLRSDLSKMYLSTAAALITLPLISIGYLWIASGVYCIISLLWGVMQAYGGSYNYSKSQSAVAYLYMLIAVGMIVLFVVSINHN